MGGQGSGRIADPVRQLAQQQSVLAANAQTANEDNTFFIPNLSGIKTQIKTRKVYLAENTYFCYNDVTQQVELYVNGAIAASWG